MDIPDRLLSVQDLAEYLGVLATTLYQWRYRREGPRGFRVGRHIRYQLTDVTEWVERQIENANP
jgi:excisionase family DNA binding protein